MDYNSNNVYGKDRIFCSAAANIDKMYFESARQIGEWMSKTGKTLIYGGADLGLMECVARAVKEENGGKVIGVVPTKLEEKMVCTFLDEVIHTHNLSERKDIMTEKNRISGSIAGRHRHIGRDIPCNGCRFHRIPPEKSHLLQRIRFL